MNKTNGVYTIGYQGMKDTQKIENTMNELNIVKLFDIRSKPGANGKFGKNTLAKLFGDRYTSRKILGGFDHEVNEYEAWKERGSNDIQEIVRTTEAGPVLVMCFERKYAECHRSYFMGQALMEQGIKVVHL